MKKAQPLRVLGYGLGLEPCEISEATHIQLHMPGPFPYRILPVITSGRRAGTPNWTWNGSVDAPTVRPSVLTRGGNPDNETICHCWINDGKVQFLGDCTHEFAGRTVDLLEIED